MDRKTLNLYPIDYPFESLISRIKDGKLILEPEFQRKYKWDSDGHERASKFIESCLMRIPLPACYFSENEVKNHIVIDGVQRLTTIKNFCENKFKLEGLEVFEELNGKSFQELNNSIRNDILTYTIRCIILRNDNDPEIVQDIFARLNQGSVVLEAQEIRHALYPGTLDELLNKLSKTDPISQVGDSIQKIQGKDSLESQELILRFFAFSSDPELKLYDNNLKKYLDKFQRNNQNLPEDKIEELEEIFITTIERIKFIFGHDFIFKKANTTKGRPSVSIYDFLMWAISNLDESEIARNKNKILRVYQKICNDRDFLKSLSQGTQEKARILKRRDIWRKNYDSK